MKFMDFTDIQVLAQATVDQDWDKIDEDTGTKLAHFALAVIDFVNGEWRSSQEFLDRVNDQGGMSRDEFVRTIEERMRHT